MPLHHATITKHNKHLTSAVSSDCLVYCSSWIPNKFSWEIRHVIVIPIGSSFQVCLVTSTKYKLAFRIDFHGIFNSLHLTEK